VSPWNQSDRKGEGLWRKWFGSSYSAQPTLLWATAPGSGWLTPCLSRLQIQWWLVLPVQVVVWCHIYIGYYLAVTWGGYTVWQSLKPPQRRLSPTIEGTPSNFVFKLLTMLTVDILSCFAVKTTWSYLLLFCHNTSSVSDNRRLVNPKLCLKFEGIPLEFRRQT